MSEIGHDGEAPPPGSGDPLHQVTDYEQTVGMVNLLTDVRFKLAAFVPVVTGAAIALIRANDVGPLTQAILGLGGLAVALGIVVYDLRNSQIYNGAIGRAKQLERKLFGRYGGDANKGLFGSRADSKLTHDGRGTDRFLGLKVQHGTGLALVYTATVMAWAWVLFDAAARGVSRAEVETPDESTVQPWNLDWPPGRWLQEAPHASWVAAGLTAAVGVVFVRAYRKHDPPREENSMIKLTFCLRRNPQMTREEFQEYWLTKHGPLAANRAKALGVRRYVQVHTVDAEGLHTAFRQRNGGSPEPFDGVAELWFDSLDAIGSGGDAAVEAGKRLLEDERKFIDLPNSPMWLGEEQVIIGS